MHCASLWNVDSTKILARLELATVLADVKPCAARRAKVPGDLDLEWHLRDWGLGAPRDHRMAMTRVV